MSDFASKDATKNDQLKKQNREFAAKLIKMKTLQDQVKAKDDQLAAMIEDLNIKNTALTKENSDFASKLVNLEAKDSILMTKVTSLTEQNTVLKTNLTDFESQIGELKTRVILIVSCFVVLILCK